MLAGELDIAQLLPLGLKVWEEFLCGDRVEMLSVEHVGARQLLDLYFEQLPPFSENKKSEFPDAISLLALEQWQKADGGELYLIGDDPDIKAWCESHPRMHHVPHLKEFVDLYNRTEQQLSGLAVSLFEREEDWIVSVIQDAFVECTFSYAGDWEADVENIAIASTLIDDIFVIEVDETHFVLTLNMEIKFSADISGASHGLVVEANIAKVSDLFRCKIVRRLKRNIVSVRASQGEGGNTAASPGRRAIRRLIAFTETLCRLRRKT